MKTLFTLLMPVLITMTAIASYKLFMQADYYLSALLSITSYLASSLWIYIITERKIVLS